jgi:NAD-dependent deacetylase
MSRLAIHERVLAGEEMPVCGCGGFLKPDAVFFGESIAPDRLRRAVASSERAQVFLVAGSSLAVRPAGALPEKAIQAGARLIIVNDSPTRLDDLGGALLRGKTGEILPALVSAILD